MSWGDWVFKVKKANGALQKQIEESGMPEVLEYVNQKATAHQLKKEKECTG